MNWAALSAGWAHHKFHSKQALIRLDLNHDGQAGLGRKNHPVRFYTFNDVLDNAHL